MPAVKEGESIQALRQAVQEDAAETDIQEIAKMSTGFARAKVAGLASFYVDNGIRSCRETVGLNGNGKLTVDVCGVKWEISKASALQRKRFSSLLTCHQVLL